MIVKYLEENSNNEPQIGHVSRQLTTQKLTGQTTTDIMNNIYDLEGNNTEWTTIARAESTRIFRGGYFDSMSDSDGYLPASYGSYGTPTGSYSSIGSRITIYL